MASPASVGTTLLDAAGVYGPTYIGERDAIKLAFNDTGTVLQQSGLRPGPRVAARRAVRHRQRLLCARHGGSARRVTLPPWRCRTRCPGARDYGKTFNVTAVAVNATLKPTQEDFYAFSGQAGQVMTFQVISRNNTLNPRPVHPRAAAGRPHGQVIAYNLHEFESPDSTLLDVTLPATAPITSAWTRYRLTTGNYQLFMYSFATGPARPPPAATPWSAAAATTRRRHLRQRVSRSPGSAGNATPAAAVRTSWTCSWQNRQEVVTGRRRKEKDIAILGPIAESPTTGASAASSIGSAGYGQAISLTGNGDGQRQAAPGGSVCSPPWDKTSRATPWERGQPVRQRPGSRHERAMAWDPSARTASRRFHQQ